MTTVISPADPQVRDFSARVDVRFTIDGDTFVGVPQLPAMQLIEFASMNDQLDEAPMNEQIKILPTMIQMMLTEESAELFIERMSSRTNPIALHQIMQIFNYLMEEYGMRPPEQSEDSSSGPPSPEPGTSSMESGSPAESTSPSSPPTDSST